jgi:long-chain acyl-CoA synthetase
VDAPRLDGLIVSGARQLGQSTLLERAARAASGFAALGIAENDAVALVLRNDFPFFEAAMGAGLVGAYAVPVNWHFKSDEAGYVLRDCGARAVVVHADLLPQIRDGIPAGVHVFAVPTPPEIREAYGIPAEAGTLPPG